MAKKPKLISQVKEYLKTNDIKQYELAQRLGIPPSTVTRWFKTGSMGNQSIQLLKKEGILK